MPSTTCEVVRGLGLLADEPESSSYAFQAAAPPTPAAPPAISAVATTAAARPSAATGSLRSGAGRQRQAVVGGPTGGGPWGGRGVRVGEVGVLGGLDRVRVLAVVRLVSGGVVVGWSFMAPTIGLLL